MYFIMYFSWKDTKKKGEEESYTYVQNQVTNLYYHNRNIRT